LIHDNLGSKPEDRQYSYYNPKDNKDIEFPFRADTFITSVSKAKVKLGFLPNYSIESEIPKEVKEYINP
jgi:hypothetical protein